MFTGIVERTGVLVSSRALPGGRALRIDAGPLAGDCVPGASIAVSGVCLTVTHVEGSVLTFDVITESLRRTTLGDRNVGDRVNLERSLRAGDRLDGHFVQGHVDGRATVSNVRRTPAEYVISLRPEETVRPYLIPKGSVALDGVSLTIAEVLADHFTVALIPTTLERTTLAGLETGHRVNVESDIIARTIIHRLDAVAGSNGLSMDRLRKAGFV